jgi:hypothetical protein
MVLVHLHAHGACPCPCFISMLNVHVPVHVHAAHHRCVCVFVYVFTFVCINARIGGLCGIQSVRYRNEKTNDAGTSPVSDQAKAVQHFLVRYRTEIIDAGMTMPAFVSCMPMPSYDSMYIYWTSVELEHSSGGDKVQYLKSTVNTWKI